MKIIHGIFTNDINKGNEYIQFLLKHNNDANNKYRLFGFSEHQLGVRVNYAHIDKHCLAMSNGNDILQNSIKPCVTPHNNIENKIIYW